MISASLTDEHVIVEAQVVVDFPGVDGGRQVQVGKLSVGRVYGLWDVVVFLQRAGLPWDEDEIARSDRIEWRGGGPDAWGT